MLNAGLISSFPDARVWSQTYSALSVWIYILIEQLQGFFEMPALTAVGKGEAAELLLVKARGCGQVNGVSAHRDLSNSQDMDHLGDLSGKGFGSILQRGVIKICHRAQLRCPAEDGQSPSCTQKQSQKLQEKEGYTAEGKLELLD